MNPNRRKLKVHIGQLKATVYRWTHPASGKKAWRFAYRDGDRWKYITRATQGEAVIRNLPQVSEEMGTASKCFTNTTTTQKPARKARRGFRQIRPHVPIFTKRRWQLSRKFAHFFPTNRQKNLKSRIRRRFSPASDGSRRKSRRCQR
jgi:hypothetical protein